MFIFLRCFWLCLFPLAGGAVSWTDIPTWVHPLVEPHLGLDRDLDALEVLAGRGEVSKALVLQSFQVASIDALDGSAESNILSFRGFCNILRLLLRVRVGGLLWLAPPCATWIYISSSWHRRCPENRYRGNRRWLDIRESNSMAVLVAALISLATFRQVSLILEQPSSSTLFQYGPVRQALRAARAGSLVTYLRSFCKYFPLVKPLKLAFTCPWATHLSRNMPFNRTPAEEAYSHDALNDSVTGGPMLASTSAYPPEFAAAVSSLHLEKTFVKNSCLTFLCGYLVLGGGNRSLDTGDFTWRTDLEQCPSSWHSRLKI